MPSPEMLSRTARLRALAVACALAVSLGCAPRSAVVGADVPEEEHEAPLFQVAEPPVLLDDGDIDSFREAIGQSLAWLQGRPEDEVFDYAVRTVTAAEMADALRRLDVFLGTGPSPEALSTWIVTHFEVIEARQEVPGRVMVTGYYEPVIAGSDVRTEAATVPVYRRPDDLVTLRLRDFRADWPAEQTAGRVVDGRLVPYFSRREIQEEGALADRDLELAWVEDRVDLFFLEVQGSGAIQFPDGREMRVGYAASNGHPYRSIGRLLIDEGTIPADRMSMQALRAYLSANPDEVSRVLNANPSAVFFHELQTAPVGFLGVPVTAGRSVALDYRVFPPSALAFLETNRPALDAEGRVIDGRPLRRFVLNQDTGGAIRGLGRVDFFWGRGEEAERNAGLMQQAGRLVLLVPRPETR